MLTIFAGMYAPFGRYHHTILPMGKKRGLL
jgi:hypothetical protein